jgi:hypothetical protein
MNYVRDNFEKIPTEEIAKNLNRTKRAIFHMYERLGLEKTCVKPGDKFNRLEIKEIWSERKGGQNATRCLCLCDCGKYSKCWLTSLVNDRTVSCGCYHRERAAERAGKLMFMHGLTQHPLNFHWNAMKARCKYKSQLMYKNYGGRGIKVCQEWLDDFMNFYNWAINNGWEEGLTLDRIDCNGNYCPENCRWATYEEQANNKRSNVNITAFGETKTLAQWTRDPRCKTKPFNIQYRISQGYTAEEAISTPTNGKYRRKVIKSLSNN